MAEKVIFCNRKINLQVDEDAVRFYPSLHSKVEHRNDKNSVISLYDISVDALKILVDWIDRHQHDVGRTVFDHTENPVTVTLSNDDEESLNLVDNNIILEIVQVADEYDMMDLLDGACQIVAPIIENMNLVELKAKFFASGDSLNEEEGFLGSDDEL
ncbi:GSCOCG00010598001-RA-CDS [Cotesia congregata]|uniref:Similar to scon-3: E3 ubiquitin ligase complex SCF subunit scon-3 (Neurospora crassa (Strain ATCC 24698 / 74-OR23-1A / CBS 708.71 / DSM 1257 / FGSC 987)) n=1 Tax=Cotesia congregata TaxID=51543 RepID=A0A8J2MNM2_COTCN|nr:GSCOCG00010598001-RA-CDS [Cotesia congregata]CAG5100836.1 Similar to scon-3: E3 ubiquitin ligase complex SCF subunit scon-3 (Neurospora crassa (strain ATCC 24698 / 74-OR23-1A / CBS 708.71 / DSM 1257 / FGSC 987)) [Cotesia congregata]